MGIYNPGDGGGGVAGVSSFNARTGAVTLTSGDVTGALTYTPAPTASPAFTGNPTAPTQAPADNSTNLATTAYVDNAVSGAGVSSFNSRTGAVTLLSADVTTAIGYTPTSVTSLTGVQSVANFKTGLALNNVDNTSDANKPVSTATQTALNLKANLASPALTGSPTAPTQSPGDNSTKLATTGYVDGGLSLKADLASPALSGAPTAPTAAPGTNTTQIATTAFVAAAVTSGVPVAANPTATAGDTANNGVAATYMRSDASPAIQLGSSTLFGLVKVDNTTITASGGVISAVGGGSGPSAGNPTATAGATAINGVAGTFMRSDAAPAIAQGSSSVKGIVQVDGTTITASGGVITATGFLAIANNLSDLANTSAARTNLGLEIGTNVQAYSANLSIYASVPPALGILPFIAVPNSANLLSALPDATGTGSLVFATSPTLVTPVLGTPASGTLTNCTGLPIATGVGGLGTGVATALGVNVGSTGAVVVQNGALGTPSSGTLTSCTGLPITTGVSGLGTNMATFLATPTSANLAATVTDETGAGALVFAASPALTGAPTAPTQTAGDNSTRIATTAYADKFQDASITFIIDGGGSAITPGIKGDLEIPFACTILGWTLLADQPGSTVVDIWKDTYTNYPPVVGDSITGSTKPTISAANKGQSSTLTGWTITISAGDILRYNVDSATTITRVTVALKVRRT